MAAWWMMAVAAAAGGPEESLAEGIAHQRAGRVEQAIVAYESCLSQQPQHPGCLWEIGWSHWSQGNWQGVVDAWSPLRTLQPGRPHLETYLPQAERHLAHLQELFASLEQQPATTRAPVTEGRTIRIRAVGDIMLGSTFPEGHMPEDDAVGALADVTDWLADADLTFGNLEGPLCDTGVTRKCGTSENCYAFRSPTRYARHLKAAGFDLLSTANNHSGDFGETCRRATEQTLDAAGIAWSGAPGTVATRTVDGLKVGMVAFHTAPETNYLLDGPTASRTIAAAAAQHDVVIVSFHGGAEGTDAMHVPDGPETFYGEDRGDLRRFARRAIEAGADVVFGHGPHVPRGFELIDGHLVAYSLGNFATYGRFSLKGHLATSLVLDVTLDHEGRLVRGAILPVHQVGRGIPRKDDDGTAIALINDLTRTDFPDTGPSIAQDGTFTRPTAAPIAQGESEE